MTDKQFLIDNEFQLIYTNESDKRALYTRLLDTGLRIDLLVESETGEATYISATLTNSNKLDPISTVKRLINESKTKP